MSPDGVKVQLDVRDWETGEAFRRVIGSAAGFQVLDPDDYGAVQLLVLEVGEDLEREFRRIEAHLALGEDQEVFLTSARPDPEMLVLALRMGAREFFSQPVKEKEIVDAIERYKERRIESRLVRRQRRRGKIISVLGAKGGVGTTTLAVNLAASLVELDKEKSVALFEMNRVYVEVPLFLDISPNHHWGEIARNLSRLDPTLLMSLMHKHTTGMHVLSSPGNLDEQYAATPEVMEKLLDLMKTLFNYIVVEPGSVMDDVSAKILQMSDVVVLVCILSLPSLANVNRLLKVFFELGYPPENQVKVVVSRFMSKSEISLADAERSINKKVFWKIPNDYRTTLSAINQGKTLAEISKKAPVTREIRRLASVLFEAQQEKEEESVPRFLWKLLGRK